MVWDTAIASARSDFRNLSRAGVARNRSATVTRVPRGLAAGVTVPVDPASTVISKASSAPSARDVTVSRLTEPIEGSASPRKPRVGMANRLSSGSFEVACRSTARARSVASIPCPSSITVISVFPPLAIPTEIDLAPASSAFSTNSLTTDAGRSTTSPAAIRLTVPSGSRRIGISARPASGFR